MNTSSNSGPGKDRIQPLPDDLARSIEGKDSGTASTLLSSHRTQLSEHRTDLSEHRTELSEHRTGLSVKRTGLADLRSHLANERTHLSYLRTAISLIGFGITINRFSVFLQEHGKLASDQTGPLLRSSEHAGAGMVGIGLVLIMWSLYRYWHVNQDIEKARFRPLHRAVVMLTVLLILAGGTTTVWLFLQQ
jgi:putative membrane protein